MTASPLIEVAPAPFAALAPLAVASPRRHSPRPTVRRPRLVSALASPAAPPLAVLVAPAGFGKTTVLREWDAADPRPFAWLTLGPGHGDARTLTQAVARALDAAFSAAPDGRAVLVLDNVHVVRTASALATIAAIADELPDEVRPRRPRPKLMTPMAVKALILAVV